MEIRLNGKTVFARFVGHEVLDFVYFNRARFVLGFLRSRRDKAKQKKAKKKSKDSIDNQSNKEEKSDM